MRGWLWWGWQTLTLLLTAAGRSACPCKRTQGQSSIKDCASLAALPARMLRVLADGGAEFGTEPHYVPRVWQETVEQ